MLRREKELRVSGWLFKATEKVNDSSVENLLAGNLLGWASYNAMLGSALDWNAILGLSCMLIDPERSLDDRDAAIVWVSILRQEINRTIKIEFTEESL